MNTPHRWKVFIAIILGALFLGACAPLAPTPKKIVKGTSTPTPFLPQATFTATPEGPPTPIRVQASSREEAPRPSPSPTGSPLTSGTPPSLTTTPSLTSNTTNTPTITRTPSPTYTVAPTNTAQAADPELSVSVATNCRAGPGLTYTRLGSLYPHQTADLLGRHAFLDYWVIKLPGSGVTCWLWGYYANPSGSYDRLPEMTPPPSPSPWPSATFTATQPLDSTPATATDVLLPTLTYTPSPVPPSPTPGSPPPPTPTAPPSNTPLPSNTPSPAPPTATPQPTSTPDDSKYCGYTSVLSGYEQQIKNMINDARADHGLPALKTNWNLKYAARDHGRDMTCNGIYSHTSSDGTTARERISLALGRNKNWCYNNCCCSEIFYSWGSPQEAFNWWMTHPSSDPDYDDNIHKRTILSQYSTDLGVGVIHYNDGSRQYTFYTVDFARP